eukprot:CFRG2886T1
MSKVWSVLLFQYFLHAVVLTFTAAENLVPGFTSSLEITTPQDSNKPPADRGEDSDNVIFGGRLPSRRYPWLASLQKTNDNDVDTFYHVCGGSLIHSQWILTAAHCTENIDRVCLGGENLQNLGNEFDCYEVERFVPHEQYVDGSFNNDIMLVKIRGKHEVDPIILNQDGFFLTKGTKASLAGWGLTETSGNVASETLLALDVEIQDRRFCSVYGPPIPRPLPSSMICNVGVAGRGTCSGDSGGPLFISKENIQLGITSFGSNDCASGSPIVFTDARSFIEWIESRIQHQLPKDSTCHCLNEGVCQLDNTGINKCVCPFGFQGENCEINLSTSLGCATQPCLNNGLCYPISTENFVCLCTTGLTGKNCHLLKSGANSKPCDSSICPSRSECVELTIGVTKEEKCICADPDDEICFINNSVLDSDVKTNSATDISMVSTQCVYACIVFSVLVIT